jgi:hypothetical protein
MQGHVMPLSPHTLIGLGPFANLDYIITFTKTGVTVVDPTDGHCVLKGWRETTGPQLWYFPLTSATPSPPALEIPSAKPTTEPIITKGNIVPITPKTTLHLSQGIQAFDPQGKACSVLYLYGAAQAMALAANSSNTVFDPCSMDLPSISALVGGYHACLGFPKRCQRG